MPRIVIADNVDRAYHRSLEAVWTDGEIFAPRDQSTRELRNVTVVISNPAFKSITTKDEERNITMLSYMHRELSLYNKGVLSAADWRDKASKFWWELRNPDDTINSNYGYLTNFEYDAPGVWQSDTGISQWQWAYKALINDDATRQAVMHFNRPRHQWQGNKDFPCTMHSSFHIRDDKLHYTVVMRSQDLIKGFPYDVPFFIWQQHLMASMVEKSVGEFTLMVHSFHVYERDIEIVRRML